MKCCKVQQRNRELGDRERRAYIGITQCVWVVPVSLVRKPVFVDFANASDFPRKLDEPRVRGMAGE